MTRGAYHRKASAVVCLLLGSAPSSVPPVGDTATLRTPVALGVEDRDQHIEAPRVSTSDFEKALIALLGKDASGLSAATVA